jgi:hypothetical protein
MVNVVHNKEKDNMLKCRGTNGIHIKMLVGSKPFEQRYIIHLPISQI